MATTTLHLDATCPTDPIRQGRCASCLREQLAGTPGIGRIELHCHDGADQATLELEYDPALVSLSELNAGASRAGACLSPLRSSIVLGIDGMASPRSEPVIERALSKLEGVAASASYSSRSLRLEFDRRKCEMPEIARRLNELGLSIRPGGPRPIEREKPLPAPQRIAGFVVEHRLLVMALIGAALLIVAYATAKLGGPAWLRYTAVAGCFVLAGWYTAIDTFKILWQLRFDIDVLMFAAAFGAAAIGNYEEGGLLLVLFALGGAGEELAMDRARRAIAALTKLAPEVATVRDPDGRERQVAVAELKIADKIVVRPFDRVAADGVVVTGASAIDQSPITGESIPVEKTTGQTVFAGTINGEGLLVVSVSKAACDTTLAKIVKLVEEAQTTKSPTQVFTDKVEKVYVPLVLIGTAALIFIPPLLGLHHQQVGKGIWAGWFYQAMAFLTGASPCALAIGTPAAVLSGIARAARMGVLVKGGVHLENLGRVQAVAFDKTGTLTRGRPDVTDVDVLDPSMPVERLLALAAAVEKGSTHPIAAAIVEEARHRNAATLEAVDVQQVAGVGMTAMVDRRKVFVGRAEPTSTESHVHAFELQGKTTVMVTLDDAPIGVIALADRPRPNAAESLRRLKSAGVRHVIMLTGDRRTVAQSIATELGVDEFHGDLMPQDKLAKVRDLEARYGPIAMVGDGVNDAPALATATVGIAMGGAGTDVAIETADIALMSDDLAKLPDAIALSRYSRRIIKQNLVIALGVIGVLAPSAALGFAPLGLAVLFHEGSTVVVVLNSMRLLVFKPRK